MAGVDIRLFGRPTKGAYGSFVTMCGFLCHHETSTACLGSVWTLPLCASVSDRRRPMA